MGLVTSTTPAYNTVCSRNFPEDSLVTFCFSQVAAVDAWGVRDHAAERAAIDARLTHIQEVRYSLTLPVTGMICWWQE